MLTEARPFMPTQPFSTSSRPRLNQAAPWSLRVAASHPPRHARLASVPEPLIRLRRARTSDNALVWQWANDPTVREASFSSAPIRWEDHVKWFDDRLADEASAIYIATARGGAEI